MSEDFEYYQDDIDAMLEEDEMNFDKCPNCGNVATHSEEECPFP